MLPFRSGRAGILGAPGVFLLFALLGCTALAAEKTGDRQAETKASTKTPNKPDEGLTKIPLTVGHDAKGLVLPNFDRLGHLRGRLESGVARRIDDEHVEFRGMKFTTFTLENQIDLEIAMTDSIFNLKTQMLDSSQRSTVKRADFEISGDTMQFDIVSRKGKLMGNVKMVVSAKSHLLDPEHE